MLTDPNPAAPLRHAGDPLLRRITGFLLILAGACAGAAIVLLALPSATGSGFSSARAGAARPTAPPRAGRPRRQDLPGPRRPSWRRGTVTPPSRRASCRRS